jgi:hypothetical protein
LQRGYESETSSSITGPIRFDSMGRRLNFTIYVVDGNRDDLIAKWNPDDPKVVQFLKSEEAKSWNGLIREILDRVSRMS